jgi:crotonobetainyl-CoA:carnitine CoA-transferase CaiB-like acyl-CoA transferase
VRVIELGTIIAGPFAGRLLADFGAEVIKIEDPRRPDPMREWGNARYQDETLWWRVQSRNKKCVTLDLKNRCGRDFFLNLVENSDVLLENLRPGKLEELELGPDELWERNPKLVIARVSGFGQTGGKANSPGYAAVAEAIGGLRHLNGFPGEAPPRSGISLGDSLAAMFAVQGILMALYWRDVRGGAGQVIDVSLVESCFALLESAVPDFALAGHIRGPSGTRLDGISPSNIFRTADDRWLVIAANQDSVFSRLAVAMGEADLVEDPRFATHRARGVHQDELEDRVAAWASRYSCRELVEILERVSVPCGPINTIADIFADPLFTERDMLLRVRDPNLGDITVPGITPKLSVTPGGIDWLGPDQPGSHNDEVLMGLLGAEAHELDQLRKKGVL